MALAVFHNRSLWTTVPIRVARQLVLELDSRVKRDKAGGNRIVAVGKGDGQ